MPHAIRLYQHGGPEVLQLETISMPLPGPGEVLLRQAAASVNFIDIYQRNGSYSLPDFPCSLGLEGSGVIEAKAPDVEAFHVGDRVAYVGGPPGAYATHRAIHQRHLVKLPGQISNIVAAGVMLRGLTAHYLLRRTFMVQPEHTILVHAAAGGVGLLLCQWAKFLGATVIGTVGNEEKAELAHQYGCDYPLLYEEIDFPDAVRDITGGRGVDAVYDSIGEPTFLPSLSCLRPLGIMVSFGQSAGPVPSFDLSLLQRHGSLFLTRPSLFDYIADPMEYMFSVGELLDMLIHQKLHVNINQSYYLEDAARAHADLEARRTTGSTVLIIDPENG